MNLIKARGGDGDKKCKAKQSEAKQSRKKTRTTTTTVAQIVFDKEQQPVEQSTRWATLRSPVLDFLCIPNIVAADFGLV